jgi:DNA-binding transcriptional LysR family regulator
MNLSKRDADVAIGATDNPPENLIGRCVASIGWALYSRADEFPSPDATNPENLYERDWVSLGDNLATLKAVKFVHKHVPPERIGYKVNTVLGLAESVEQGVGVGHLPCFIGDARPGLVRLSPLDPEFAADLWLLTHFDLRQSPRVRVFLDFLAAEVAKQRRFIQGTGSSSATTNETVTADLPANASL